MEDENIKEIKQIVEEINNTIHYELAKLYTEKECLEQQNKLLQEQNAVLLTIINNKYNRLEE